MKDAKTQGREWYVANRERKLAYQRAYRARNLAARIEYDRGRWRDDREAMRKRDRERHARTKERRNALRRAARVADLDGWRAKKRAAYWSDVDASREASRRSRKRNHQKIIGRNAIRRAREKGASVVERVDRLAIFERDGGVCHICRLPADPAKFHLDHRLPLVRGGAHAAFNLFVAHPRCNIVKKDRLPRVEVGH